MSIFRIAPVWAAHLALVLTLTAQAQGLRLSPRAVASGQASVDTTTRQSDFIVAIVNSEPITNREVALEVQRVSEQALLQRQTLPSPDELNRQVLERMINERAQLHLAREAGVRVEESSVDQAEQMVAMQNQLDVAELRRRLAADGIDQKRFRKQLREQLTLQRLREREVEPRVQVSDLELDQYLQSQQAAASQTANRQINLAQLLVAVPEGASQEVVDSLQAKARKALSRARAGEDFAALVRELSDAPDRVNGGEFGLRNEDRYPQLFLEAVQPLTAGGISELVRSGAGFHILKLLERRSASNLPPAVVTQSHARHILLKTSSQMTEVQARERLLDFKRRIESGQSTFAALAREYSQDGSAAQGGDLGWASPGMFVPEFEAVMNRLAPGQISQPLISRFGVHLIQLLERRNTQVSEAERREMVRKLLRERKFEEAYVSWAQEVRGRAYVEMREPPQ
ncbi:MAG: peptidylprolyl isomerase [Hylemonella sp.]